MHFNLKFVNVFYKRLCKEAEGAVKIIGFWASLGETPVLSLLTVLPTIGRNV